MRQTDPSNRTGCIGNTPVICFRCFNSTVNICAVSGSESAKAQTVACMAGLLTDFNPDAFPSGISPGSGRSIVRML